MTTKIYKTYGDFLARENQDENGVSEVFAENNPSWEKMNQTNKACWSCFDCFDCSCCSCCSRCFDCSCCSDCFDKKSDLTFPIIENIHAKVLEAVTKTDKSLNMSKWHTCDTTHCRAGWVVTLAGKAGLELEEKTSTAFAASMIYKASSPIRVYYPRFFETDEQAMADIKRCAEEEAKLIK